MSNKANFWFSWASLALWAVLGTIDSHAHQYVFLGIDAVGVVIAVCGICHYGNELQKEYDDYKKWLNR